MIKKVLLVISLVFTCCVSFSCFEDSSNDGNGLDPVNATFQVNYNFIGTPTGNGWVTCRLYTSKSDIGADPDNSYYEVASNLEGPDMLDFTDDCYNPSYVLIFYDANDNFILDTGESYMIYDSQTDKANADSITFTEGGTTVINMNFDDTNIW